MNDHSTEITGRAAQLRRTFDLSFAAPVTTERYETIDLIAIRLGDATHALRLAEIAGIFVDVAVTPCPSRIAAFRGLAGFRGTMLPVYDLASLLGRPRSAAPRWLVTAANAPTALAFDAFDRHFTVAPGAIATQQDGQAAGHVREIVRGPDSALPIIDIPSVVVAIREQMPDDAHQKER